MKFIDERVLDDRSGYVNNFRAADERTGCGPASESCRKKAA